MNRCSCSLVLRWSARTATNGTPPSNFHAERTTAERLFLYVTCAAASYFVGQVGSPGALADAGSLMPKRPLATGETGGRISSQR